MRATKLVLMAVSLLITANLVRTCIRGNDGYKKAADKYCNKPCSASSECGWPCYWCKRDAYQQKRICKTK
uniref:Putative 5.3 kDa protein n=1 Tax=Ixodes ricinus TaxID=34613 RepID=A0A6B0TX55_IXORI